MEAKDYSEHMHLIVADAIRFCQLKDHQSKDEFLEALHANRGATHSRFRYALAKGVSRYLATIDDNLQSVYVYGSTMTDNARKASDIDLIVKVKAKNKTTQDNIKILDLCLRRDYQNIMGNFVDDMGMGCMLNAHIVDDGDILQRKNYGSVLTNLFTVPIKVWGG